MMQIAPGFVTSQISIICVKMLSTSCTNTVNEKKQTKTNQRVDLIWTATSNSGLTSTSLEKLPLRLTLSPDKLPYKLSDGS